MRAVILDEAFGLENLRGPLERADESIGPRDVRVRMTAASLNYRDLLMVRGHYDPRQALPLIPCSDGVGVVEAIGDSVTRFSVGDRVLTTFSQTWTSPPVPRRKAELRHTLGGPLDGTLADRRVLSEDGLVAAPRHMTDQEAVTLPCAALTAWSALVTQGGLQAGDVVVAQGTGGVSIAALQIGVMCGAKVIVTSSSDEKLERARQLGAHETINYRSIPEWGRRVRELTGGIGADHVIEVGGAGTLEQSIRAVHPGAQVSVIGVLAGGAGELKLLPVVMQNIRLQGILVGSRTELEAMIRAYEAHEEVRPVLDSTLDWTEARAAFEHLASGRHFGKIVLEIA